jgi:chromosome segregation ATPase
MVDRGSRAFWQAGLLGLCCVAWGCRATSPNRVREARADVLRTRADGGVEALLKDIAAREAALESNRRQARELEKDLEVAVAARKERATDLSQVLSLVEALEQDLAAAEARAEEIRQAQAAIDAQAAAVAERDVRVKELEDILTARAARIAALEAEVASDAAALAAKEAELVQRKTALTERLQKLEAALTADQPVPDAGSPPKEATEPPAKGDG